MEMKSLLEKDDKEVLSFRCPKGIKIILKEISKQTGVNKSNLLMSIIIESIINYKEEILFNGINMKEYAQLCKLEILRNIAKKERNEFLSSQFFMARVKTDIYKIMMLSSKRIKTNRKAVLEEVLKYLDIREKEAKHHKQSKKLFEEIGLFRKEAKENLENMKQIIGQKSEIEGLKI